MWNTLKTKIDDGVQRFIPLTARVNSIKSKRPLKEEIRDQIRLKKCLWRKYIKMYLFVDDAKLYCHVKNNGNIKDLQTRIKKFVEWTDKWQMKLNIEKCKVISFHHRRYSNNGVIPNYTINSKLLEEVTEIKDLGVYYDPLLLFDKHICEKVKKAYDVGYN